MSRTLVFAGTAMVLALFAAATSADLAVSALATGVGSLACAIVWLPRSGAFERPAQAREEIERKEG